MTTRLLNTQRIVNLSSDPVSGTAGEVYYNTATNLLKVYTGASWINVGGSSLPSQTENSGKFLSTNGTAASWESVTKTTVGLANVENIALSTWAGSTNITTLGTITTGTWQGSSISTAYTAAKVTSVNGSTGAVTGLATTAGNLSQFAATTSAQLAGVISDETGSGVLVFGTSPNFTTDIEVNAGSLSSTAATVLTPLALNATTTNGDYLRFKLTRESTGSDWTTAGWKIQRTVDVTNMGYVEFGSTSTHDVRIGSNTTDIAVFAPSQITFSQEVIFPAATTSAASINLAHGTAPTAPSNGDIWTTTSGVYARINGSTVGPFIDSATAAVSDTAPSTANGKLWYDSSSGKTYVYYQDGTSNQWVEIGSAATSPTGNYDGGLSNSNYGGVSGLDGGGAT